MPPPRRGAEKRALPAPLSVRPIAAVRGEPPRRRGGAAAAAPGLGLSLVPAPYSEREVRVSRPGRGNRVAAPPAWLSAVGAQRGGRPLPLPRHGGTRRAGVNRPVMGAPASAAGCPPSPSLLPPFPPGAARGRQCALGPGPRGSPGQRRRGLRAGRCAAAACEWAGWGSGGGGGGIRAWPRALT